jgi:CHAT domain-containing protein
MEFIPVLNQAYRESDLLHFASHGLINLEYPELSKLMLPGQSDAGISNYLTPVDIRQSSLSAKLVVLSACETTGVNSFIFDSHLGFVSEFLNSGAGAVVASLWPVSDTFTREFMLGFYSALLSGISAPQALTAIKRRYLVNEETSSDLNWSSFQIYIK